jgi:hypothetical protein
MKRTAPLPPVESLVLPSSSKQAPVVRVLGDFGTGNKPKPAGDYVWRDPATGTIVDPPAQPPTAVVAAAAERETRWWFWFWLIIGVLFVVFFVGLLLWPTRRYEWNDDDHHGGWPDKSPAIPSGPGVGDSKEDCTSDELWSEEAHMCIMRSYYPQAVSPAIMDTSVSPCTDIYRHACGKWLDTHTNENRGFAGLAALNGVAVRNIVLNKSVANLNPFYQVGQTSDLFSALSASLDTSSLTTSPHTQVMRGHPGAATRWKQKAPARPDPAGQQTDP